MFPQLEALLFPIMQKNISTEGQEIFEEVRKGEGEGGGQDEIAPPPYPWPQ